MTDILDYISTWSIFKWIMVVLIAGFISQFGKMMAETIAGNIRLRHVRKQQLSEAASVVTSASPKPTLPSSPSAMTEISNKKLIKALAKTKKKEAKKKKS
jgi:hypothetical protein